jgi:hypothetical protein
LPVPPRHRLAQTLELEAVLEHAFDDAPESSL